MKFYILSVICLTYAVLLFGQDKPQLASSFNKDGVHSGEMDFRYLRDTIYTMMPNFIVVNLKTQKGYLYSRNEKIKKFSVSSGNKRIEDAIDTKEGLFAVKAKLPEWYSRQFDSTLMLNWMGFNYGIGFHALKTNGYYKYLGKQKSSHGCLRISRNAAKMLYDKIEIGTPVLVHSENNILNIDFANSSKEYAYYRFYTLKKLLTKRYKEIYSRQYFLSKLPKIIVGGSNLQHEGLPIGNSNKLPRRQIILPIHSFIDPVTPNYKAPVLQEGPIDNYILSAVKKIIREKLHN